MIIQKKKLQGQRRMCRKVLQLVDLGFLQQDIAKELYHADVGKVFYCETLNNLATVFGPIIGRLRRKE